MQPVSASSNSHMLVLLLIALIVAGVCAYLFLGRSTGKAAEYQSPPPTRRDHAAVTSLSLADDLSRLGDLRDQGVLTDAEFEAQKAKLLDQTS